MAPLESVRGVLPARATLQTHAFLANVLLNPQCQPGSVHQDIKFLNYIGQGADMILMAMSPR